MGTHYTLGRLYGGMTMVMTDYMWHLLFEPPRETEWMILMNKIRQKRKSKGNKNVDSEVKTEVV